MHNIGLASATSGHSQVISGVMTQHYVSTMENVLPRFRAEAEMPYGKDAYGAIADLLTKLPTNIVHNRSFALAIA